MNNCIKPKFSVITPYYKEDLKIILRAVQSVKSLISEKYDINHYLVSDGHPIDELDNLDLIHIKLPKSHGDYGDTPRLMGAMLAIREGSKGLMFLDADNIVYSNHLSEAEKIYLSTETNIVLAKRDYLRPDGSVITFKCQEDDDYSHVDTGCFLFFDEAVFEALEWAKIPREISCYGDRYFWNLLRSKRNHYGATENPTIGYSCLWRGVYESINETPPADAKIIDPSIVRKFFDSLDNDTRQKLNLRLKINN
jgi:hypothetical protein